jgi:hypothetical protein
VHGESTGETRPLTAVERSLLEAIIARVGDPESGMLRSQLEVAQAQSGCPCGCGTIDIVLPDDITASTLTGGGVVVEGDVLDDAGQPVGGLLLFVDDGRLHDLEIWSVGEPLELPPVERTRLRAAV